MTPHAPFSPPAGTVAGLKTFGTMGKAVYPLEGGVEAELFKHAGTGCLTHMWFGGNWEEIECSSTDNNTNWGANGGTPNGDWVFETCYVNCACNN